MHHANVRDHISTLWDTSAIPTLCDYISLPALSPHFDPDWAKSGHIDEALNVIRRWCAARDIAGMTIDVQRIDGLTPLLIIEVAPTSASDETVLLYGHLDKQPEMTGWRAGLGPWTPVQQGDRLYGRGGGDDGYSAFAALSAIEACQRNGGTHARLVVLIEASEESGSIDLPAHLDPLADRLGNIGLVICLDSGCLDYERLWTTTSLRGLVACTLTVEVLTEGQHSGVASGIVASSLRVIRQLLDRIENAATGRILLDALHVEIPEHRVIAATQLSEILGDPSTWLPFAGDTRPMSNDPAELLLNSTWRPTLSYIAADGLPAIGDGGNVLRPSTSLGLSFRIPPGVDPDNAMAAIARAVTTDPPDNAVVRCHDWQGARGWAAPTTAPWLAAALDDASVAYFGRPAASLSEGGSIPFMAMLGHRFPEAQFVVTGVLGPDSNAHGPNEYVHLPTAKKVSMAMTDILDAQARRR